MTIAVGDPTHDQALAATTAAPQQILTVQDSIPIFFQPNWRVGIGGGIWSSGLALAQYLATEKHAVVQLDAILLTKSSSSTAARDQCHRHHSIILELGSGNGLLSACVLALLQSSLQRQQPAARGGSGDNNSNNRDIDPLGGQVTEAPPPVVPAAEVRPSVCQYHYHLVVTDTKDHLPLIQKTLQLNSHLWSDNPNNSHNIHVHVLQHTWGAFVQTEEQEDDHSGPQHGSIAHPNRENDEATPGYRSKIQHILRHGYNSHDDEDDDNDTWCLPLVLGSDLAYHHDLYDPLIESLKRFSDCRFISGSGRDSPTRSSNSPPPVILLGVTMVDTTPVFFDKLEQANFIYERLADHLLPQQHRGTTLAIFAIQQTKNPSTPLEATR